MRTLRPACFCTVRVCPSLSTSMTESAVAETKRPLIFRFPRGAASWYSRTTVLVLCGTACTRDQSAFFAFFADAIQRR